MRSSAASRGPKYYQLALRTEANRPGRRRRAIAMVGQQLGVCAMWSACARQRDASSLKSPAYRQRYSNFSVRMNERRNCRYIRLRHGTVTQSVTSPGDPTLIFSDFSSYEPPFRCPYVITNSQLSCDIGREVVGLSHPTEIAFSRGVRRKCPWGRQSAAIDLSTDTSYSPLVF